VCTKILGELAIFDLALKLLALSLAALRVFTTTITTKKPTTSLSEVDRYGVRFIIANVGILSDFVYQKLFTSDDV